jgi:hypothetical protein
MSSSNDRVMSQKMAKGRTLDHIRFIVAERHSICQGFPGEGLGRACRTPTNGLVNSNPREARMNRVTYQSINASTQAVNVWIFGLIPAGMILLSVPHLADNGILTWASRAPPSFRFADENGHQIKVCRRWDINLNIIAFKSEGYGISF